MSGSLGEGMTVPPRITTAIAGLLLALSAAPAAAAAQPPGSPRAEPCLPGEISVTPGDGPIAPSVTQFAVDTDTVRNKTRSAFTDLVLILQIWPARGQKQATPQLEWRRDGGGWTRLGLAWEPIGLIAPGWETIELDLGALGPLASETLQFGLAFHQGDQAYTVDSAYLSVGADACGGLTQFGESLDLEALTEAPMTFTVPVAQTPPPSPPASAGGTPPDGAPSAQNSTPGAAAAGGMATIGAETASTAAASTLDHPHRTAGAGSAAAASTSAAPAAVAVAVAVCAVAVFVLATRISRRRKDRA